MKHHYHVSYDIRDPARLRAVHRICRGLGERIQLSVYAARLNEKELAVAVAKIRKVINNDEDQVLIVRLGVVGHEEEMEAKIIALGIQWVPEGMPELIF